MKQLWLSDSGAQKPMGDKQNMMIECGHESGATITSFDSSFSSFGSLDDDRIQTISPPSSSHLKPGVLFSEEYAVSTKELERYITNGSCNNFFDKIMFVSFPSMVMRYNHQKKKRRELNQPLRHATLAGVTRTQTSPIRAAMVVSTSWLPTHMVPVIH